MLIGGMKGALSGAMKGALSGAVKGDLSGPMAIAPASLTVTSELPSIIAASETATTTAHAWCSSAAATPMTPTPQVRRAGDVAVPPLSGRRTWRSGSNGAGRRSNREGP